MKQPEHSAHPGRTFLQAEMHVPSRLRLFLSDLETTTSSADVWNLIVALGRDHDLPFIDFISASNYQNWKRTLFIRTSYDADWLHAFNTDPDLHQWSYFRSHGVKCLTPICVGLEFLDEYHKMPDDRVTVLREAAKRGMRAGFSIPLRQHAPPQSAFMTFAGNHSKAQLLDIIGAAGWTLNAGAMMAHQRFLHHFEQEFSERNEVTPKQHELLELIGAGLLDKQIADRLGISISAVRQRQNALMQKTGMTNRAELAALAMSMGVLPHPVNRPEGPQITIIQNDDDPASPSQDG